VPASGTLGLVLIEFSFEVASVRVNPLAADELSVLEVADVLLASLIDDVGAFAGLLSALPVAGVNVEVGVGHDTLTVAFAGLPVAVVVADVDVFLLTDAGFLIIFPLTDIGDCWAFTIGLLVRVSVFSTSVSNLYRSKIQTQKLNRRLKNTVKILTPSTKSPL
jgi:hypothetical protein